MCDLEGLTRVNEAAAEQYSCTAEVAAALAQFVADLGEGGVRDSHERVRHATLLEAVQCVSREHTHTLARA